MRVVSKAVAVIFGGLIVALLSSMVIGLAIEGSQVVAFWGAWALVGIIAWRAASGRRTWGWAMLIAGIMALAAPLGTIVFTAGQTAQQADEFAAAGTVIAGGFATVIVGFVGFFLAAIFLVLALVLLSGGTAQAAANR